MSSGRSQISCSSCFGVSLLSLTGSGVGRGVDIISLSPNDTSRMAKNGSLYWVCSMMSGNCVSMSETVSVVDHKRRWGYGPSSFNSVNNEPELCLTSTSQLDGAHKSGIAKTSPASFSSSCIIVPPFCRVVLVCLTRF